MFIVRILLAYSSSKKTDAVLYLFHPFIKLFLSIRKLSVLFVSSILYSNAFIVATTFRNHATKMKFFVLSSTTSELFFASVKTSRVHS